MHTNTEANKTGSSHLERAVVKDFMGPESETLSVWPVCDDQLISHD